MACPFFQTLYFFLFCLRFCRSPLLISVGLLAPLFDSKVNTLVLSLKEVMLEVKPEVKQTVGGIWLCALYHKVIPSLLQVMKVKLQ